jgi:hypothetical protein
MDPRVTDDRVSPTDLEDQLRFNLQVRDAITAARVAAFRLTEVHDRLSRSNKDPERLKQVEALLSRLVTADGPYPRPMLIDQLLYLYLMTTQADQKIGHDASVRLADLSKELSAILGKVQEAIRQ